MSSTHKAYSKKGLRRKKRKSLVPPKRYAGARRHSYGNLSLPVLGMRKDIQGLRALAVITVIFYHAKLPYISGGFIGVDFFFVLSGFLITYLLLREIETVGRVSFKRFWGRRAKRLIPASTVVILATVVASFKLMPFTDKRPVGLDTLYSLFFAANWRFANQETDYLAEDRNPSPLLHFWSLGVEEQFYFIWPLIIGLLALFFIRRNLKLQLTLCFTLIIVASMAFNVYMTNVNQPYAFFGTPARAWQLIAGAITALWLGKISLIRPKIKLALSVIGLAIFAAAVIMLKENGQVLGVFYPSWLALAPTLGAVFLIIGGAGSDHFLTKALSLRPLVFVGDISYTLYLWHWPVLVLGVLYFGNDRLITRLSLVVLSVVLAFTTYKLVEDPIRKWKQLAGKPYLSIGVALIAIFATAIPAHALSTYSTDNKIKLDKNSKVIAKDKKPIKRYLTSTVPLTSVEGSSPGGELKPTLTDAASDYPPYSKTCQRGTYSTEEPILPIADCTFGDPDYDHTVFITGDSISTAVTPAIIEYADAHKWRVILISMARCSFTTYTPMLKGKPNIGCRDYKEAIFNKIKELKPDLLVVANSYGSNGSLKNASGEVVKGKEAYELAAEGMSDKFKELQKLGIMGAVVSLPPRAADPPVNCLAEKQDASKCHFSKATKEDFMKDVYNATPKLFYVDTLSTYCADDCFPVIRDYILYRDGVHFTNSYSKNILKDIFSKLLITVESTKD